MNKPENLNKLSKIARVIMKFDEKNIDDKFQAETIDTMISDLYDYCRAVDRIQSISVKKEAN